MPGDRQPEPVRNPDPLPLQGEPARPVQAEPAPGAAAPSPVSAPSPQSASTGGSSGKLRSLKSLEKDFMSRVQDMGPREITVTMVEEARAAYIEGVDSPSLRQFLQEAQLQVEGERLRMIVGTQMAKGMIQQDTALMPWLRERLGHPGLGMAIDVDPALAPQREEEPGGPTTPREIFELLATKNPLLLELHKRFDLAVE